MNTKLFKLAKLIMNFAETKVGDATWVHEGDLAEGVEVLVEDENGEMVPVADGEYELEDGTKVEIADGKVAKIEAKEPDEPKNPDGEGNGEGEGEDLKKPCGLEDANPDEQEPAQVEDKDAKIAELEGLLQDRDAIIEELTAKVKELEEQANAKPAEPAVQMNKVTPTMYAKADKNTIPALKYFED